MSTTRLTISLPTDVWKRLEAEAAAADKKIGTFLRDLVVKRDAKRHG